MIDIGGEDEDTDFGPRQVVHSPEQVALHFPVAGPTSRILAYAIDFVVMTITEMTLLVLLVVLFSSLGSWLAEEIRRLLPAPSEDPQVMMSGMLALLAVLVVLQVAFEMLYFVVMEISTGGRSIGKRVLRLRVVRDGGLPLGVRESLIRNLLRGADALPLNYFVGLIAMLVSPQGKRLGDLAAGTIVVRLDEPAPARPLPEADAADLAAFRFQREQIARLGNEGRALARQTLRRIDGLPPEAAEQALERAVEALRTRLGYEDVEPAQRRAFLRALLAAAQRR